MLVFGTIFHPQDCPSSIVAGLLQSTAVQGTAQSQQFPGRLGDIHIDGIELLDGRQRLSLTVADQGAPGNSRTPDLTGNRRGYTGVAQIDARSLQSRLGLQLRPAPLVVR